MKLKFSYIAYTVIAIALVIGVSRAYALTGPAGSAPSQSEISTPVNNSGESQTKQGSVITKFDLGATSWCLGGTANGIGAFVDFFPEYSYQSINSLPLTGFQVSPCVRKGTAIVQNFIVSPWGFFTQMITSSVIVGDSSSQSGDLPTVSEPVSTDSHTPHSMRLDLVGRGTGNNSVEGTQVISIYAGNMCSTYTTIMVDQPQIGFKSLATGDAADVLARQVRLTAGNPRENSVLIQGTNGSKWATLTVAGDQIVLTPN